MKLVLLKKNVIIVGKSTRSRVLRDRLRLHGAPRGPMEQKKFSIMRGRAKMKLDKTMWGKDKDPARPITIPEI